jgi:U5 small nuclear ribonucleoprotein component
VYGADVETLVQEEDTQPLTQPIIAPVKKKTFRVISKEESGPVTRYDKNFLLQLMSYQDSVRNVCVVGHLHHGKTALMDMLVYETHQLDWDVDKQVINSSFARQTAESQIAKIYGSACASSSKRHLPQINAYVPCSSQLKRQKLFAKHDRYSGACQLSRLCWRLSIGSALTRAQDEVASAVRLVDGAILVVDVIEGVR